MKNKFQDAIMEKAVEEAMKTSSEGIGGPFGAAIVREKNGSVQIVVASNTVLESHDSTAHAEVNAIREASKKFKTHDLSDCVLYATSEPCPMCRSAIIWANIKTVYYGNSAKDTAKVGFRDDFMYDYFKDGCKDEEVMHTERIHSDACVNLLSSYMKNSGQLY